MLLGGYYSSATIPMAGAMNTVANPIPIISYYAAHPVLADPTVYPYFVRTGATTPKAEASTLVRRLHKTLVSEGLMLHPSESVVNGIVQIEDAFYTAAWEGFRDDFVVPRDTDDFVTKVRVEVVLQPEDLVSREALETALQPLLEAGDPTVFLATREGVALEVIDILRDAGVLDSTLIVASGLANSLRGTYALELANGSAESEEFWDWIFHVRDSYGIYGPAFASRTLDAVHAMALALQQEFAEQRSTTTADSTKDADKLMQRLRTSSFRGITPSAGWTYKSNDPAEDSFVVLNYRPDMSVVQVGLASASELLLSEQPVISAASTTAAEPSVAAYRVVVPLRLDRTEGEVIDEALAVYAGLETVAADLPADVQLWAQFIDVAENPAVSNTSLLSGVLAAVTDTELPPLLGVAGQMTSATATLLLDTLASVGSTVPLLSASSTSTHLSSPSTYPSFLRVVPSDTSQAAAAVDVITEAGWAHVAVIYAPNEVYSSSFHAATLAAATAVDMHVSWELAVSATHSDVDLQAGVAALVAAGARVFLLASLDNEACGVLRAALAVGALAPGMSWLGVDGWGTTTVCAGHPEQAAVNAALAGVLWTSPSGGSVAARQTFTAVAASVCASPPLVVPATATALPNTTSVGIIGAPTVVVDGLAAHAAAGSCRDAVRPVGFSPLLHDAVLLYGTVLRTMTENQLDLGNHLEIMHTMRTQVVAGVATTTQWPPSSNDNSMGGYDVYNRGSGGGDTLVGSATDRGFLTVQGSEALLPPTSVRLSFALLDAEDTFSLVTTWATAPQNVSTTALVLHSTTGCPADLAAGDYSAVELGEVAAAFVSGLSVRQEVHVAVQLRNAASLAVSPISTCASFTALPPTVVTAASARISSVAGTILTATVSWTAATSTSGGVLEYVVAAVPAGGMVPAFNTSVDAVFTIADVGIVAGVEHCFQVFPVNVVGVGEPTAPVCITRGTQLDYTRAQCGTGTHLPLELPLGDVLNASCLACPPTLQQSANKSACVPCSQGLGLIDSVCTPCLPGTFSPSAGVCEACPPGTFSQDAGSTQCLPCPAGTYSTVPGGNSQATCATCPGVRTTIAAADTLLACVCPEGLFGPLLAAEGDPSWCRPCALDGGGCPAGLGVTAPQLVANPGYWRSTPESTKFYACRLDGACAGGAINGTAASTCRAGHVGVLCEDCVEGMVLTDGECTPCEDQLVTLTSKGKAFFSVVGGLLAAYIAFALVRWRFRKKYPAPAQPKCQDVDAHYRPLTVLKLILVYMQVAISVPLDLGVDAPQFVKDFADALSFLNFDAVSLFNYGCRVGDIDHYNVLVSVTLVEGLVLVFLGAVCLGLAAFGFHVWRRRVAGLALFIAFVVYPNLSKTVLESFACDDYEGVGSRLRVDSTIDCNSSRYNALVAYASVMLVVFPVGIPVAVFFLLYRSRSTLAPGNKGRVLTLSGSGKTAKVAVRGHLISPANAVDLDLQVWKLQNNITDGVQATARTSVPTEQDASAKGEETLPVEAVADTACPHGTSWALFSANMEALRTDDTFGDYVYTLKLPHAGTRKAVDAFVHRWHMKHYDVLYDLAIRDVPAVEHLAFLFEDYSPQFWYFELVELLRRLIVLSVASVFLPDTLAQLVLPLAVTTFVAVLLLRVRVYLSGRADRVATGAQWALVLLYFMGLFLTANETVDTDRVSERDINRDAVGVFMIVLMVVVPLAGCTAALMDAWESSLSEFATAFERSHSGKHLDLDALSLQRRLIGFAVWVSTGRFRGLSSAVVSGAAARASVYAPNRRSVVLAATGAPVVETGYITSI